MLPLTKQSLSFLNSVHSNFKARGIASIDYGDGLSGRSHGGLCFLWRRSLDPFIEPLIYVDKKRLLGLKNTSSNATILFLNIYLPYQTGDNADEYLEMLGKIQAISDSFESTNIFIISEFNADIQSFYGVKQGGILSPHLVNVYVDDLSVTLNKLQIGCLYAGTIMNHMMYADDLYVFSPSVAGLRKLTDCCAEYGNMFDITYNANKSFYMVIDSKPRDKKNIHPVVINNIINTTLH